MFPVFMDVLLVLMLAGTIYYCVKLNRSLKVIRDSKDNLGKLIAEFSEATNKAQAGVDELKESSKKVVVDLQEKINKANFLADDLSFMIEKASKLADKLEIGIANTKDSSSARLNTEQPKPQAAASVETASEKVSKVASLSRFARGGKEKGPSLAEQELMEALKGAKK
jgi:hypothetical protein